MGAGGAMGAAGAGGATGAGRSAGAGGAAVGVVVGGIKSIFSCRQTGRRAVGQVRVTN
jgi:hypothetical protein